MNSLGSIAILFVAGMAVAGFMLFLSSRCRRRRASSADDATRRAQMRLANDPEMDSALAEAKRKADLSHLRRLPERRLLDETEYTVTPSYHEGRSETPAAPPEEELPEEEPREECPRCGNLNRYHVGTFERIAGDEYGYVYRCPECEKLWYYDSTYATTSPTRKEWVQKVWPNLDL